MMIRCDNQSNRGNNKRKDSATFFNVKIPAAKFFILVAALPLLLSCGVSSNAAAEDKPNVVFILADDLGFNQVGAYGNTPIKTPNIDKMAKNGIRFDQAYSGNTVCSPSRVSLFTGRDSRYMSNNSNSVQLQEIDVTMAHVLKHANYDTALFGKYSIGSKMGVTDPLAMGFDTWYGMYSILEGHRQYPHILWRDGVKERLPENEGGKKGSYAPELFTNEAVDYMKQERENPFFVMLAYTIPHADLAVPSEYSDMYEFEETPYLGMQNGVATDRFAWYYPEPVDKPNAVMAGMVSALDDYVGRVINALEEAGQLDNTIIIVTSDNGPHDEGGADPDFFKASAPYKGMKRDLYDGGIHVPMILQWPAKIKKGRIDQTPWAFHDVLPTLADIADVNLDRVPRIRTNGTSIKGLLSDEPIQMDERTLYWEFSKQLGDPNSGVIGDSFQAARRGQFKAVRYGFDAPLELYNIIDDPAESTNIVDEHPSLSQEFFDMFEKYKN